MQLSAAPARDHALLAPPAPGAEWMCRGPQFRGPACAISTTLSRCRWRLCPALPRKSLSGLDHGRRKRQALRLPSKPQILGCRGQVRAAILSPQCPDIQRGRTPVVSQFDFSSLLFLYGPRGPDFGARASMSSPIQAKSRTVSERPASTAGVTRSVLWILQKL